MRLFIYLLLSVFFCSGCQSEKIDSSPLEVQLLHKLAQEKAVIQFLDKYPFSYVSQNDHCEGEACKLRLLDAGLDIPVYPKEDAFMRALRQTIVIQEIDTTVEVPFLKYQLSINNKEVGSGVIYK